MSERKSYEAVIKCENAYGKFDVFYNFNARKHCAMFKLGSDQLELLMDIYEQQLMARLLAQFKTAIEGHNHRWGSHEIDSVNYDGRVICVTFNHASKLSDNAITDYCTDLINIFCALEVIRVTRQSSTQYCKNECTDSCCCNGVRTKEEEKEEKVQLFDNVDAVTAKIVKDLPRSEKIQKVLFSNYMNNNGGSMFPMIMFGNNIDFSKTFTEDVISNEELDKRFIESLKDIENRFSYRFNPESFSTTPTTATMEADDVAPDNVTKMTDEILSLFDIYTRADEAEVKSFHYQNFMKAIVNIVKKYL